MVLPVLKGTENTSNARNNSIGNLKKKTLRLAKMAVKLRTNRPTYSTLLPIQEIGLLKKKTKKKIKCAYQYMWHFTQSTVSLYDS